MNASAGRRFSSPQWLKGWLIPVWNGGHHAARWLGDRVRAVARGQAQRCHVCGRWGLMIYRRRIIAPELVRRWGLSERLARAFARKEAACSRCGAQLRAQRLARVILDLYPVEPTEIEPRSLAAWARSSVAGQLRVAEINRVEGLHAVLGRLSRFESSDYIAGAEPGATHAGVRHEDLTRLTYPDSAFDLVITSETLEHVPDLAAAWREIQRILKPGGRHLFTVPVLPGVDRTFARTEVNQDGSIHLLTRPIYHPGGDAGYLVCTEFGADLPELVAAAGFAVDVRFGPISEDDVAQVYVARKLPDGHGLTPTATR